MIEERSRRPERLPATSCGPGWTDRQTDARVGFNFLRERKDGTARHVGSFSKSSPSKASAELQTRELALVGNSRSGLTFPPVFRRAIGTTALHVRKAENTTKRAGWGGEKKKTKAVCPRQRELSAGHAEELAFRCLVSERQLSEGK